MRSKNIIKKTTIYILVFFVLLVFASFLKEVAFYIKDAFDNFLRTLFVLPWIALLIYFTHRFVSRFQGIKPWEFIGLAAFLGAFISILGLLVNFSLGTDDIIEKNYIGVYGVTYGYDSNTESEVQFEHKTNVYSILDKSRERELNNLESEFGESSYDEFIFWQTAYAYGFEPKYISEYKGAKSFGRILTLFFTVGPIFLLESFIVAIMNCWLLMIIPIVGLFFKKRMLVDQLKPFIDFFYGNGEKGFNQIQN